MLLNLTKAKNEEGRTQSLDVSFPLDGDLLRDRGCVALSPVSLKGSFEYQNEELHLTATASVKLQCICDSCAENFEKTFTFPVREKFVEDYNIKGDEDYVINHYAIELDTVVTDNFLEHFPTKIKCSTDCKGLCSVCGKNKNFQTCNCEEIAKQQEQLENKLNKIKIGDR